MRDSTPTPTGSRLARTLEAGRFALTTEVTPPVSGDFAQFLADARPLAARVDAVNVTDGPNARVHASSLAGAAALARDGIEPVFQLTCRDRNRIALQSDLLGAAALGIHNVLVLRGDDPSAGDQPEAMPVFDLESRDLIRIAAGMSERGVLASGRAIDRPPRFFLGAADTPVDPPADWRPDGLEAKLAAGVRFVQTQICFDIGLIRRYAARLRDLGLTERAHFLIGLGLVRSARSAVWMREHLWGVVVPDEIVRRMEGTRDQEAEGIRICVELLQALAETPGVSGAHVMAPASGDRIPRVIEASGLGRRDSAVE